MFGDVDYDPSCAYPVSSGRRGPWGQRPAAGAAPLAPARGTARARQPRPAPQDLPIRCRPAPLFQSVPLEEQLEALGRAVDAGKVSRAPRRRSARGPWRSAALLSC
jgi:hypothetical protein